MFPTQQTNGLRWFDENSVYSKILAGEGVGDAHTRQGHSVPWEHTHSLYLLDMNMHYKRISSVDQKK